LPQARIGIVIPLSNDSLPLGVLQLVLRALAGFLLAIEFFEIVTGMLSMAVWIWAIISSAIAEEKPIPAIVAAEAHGA
jgi:hypothetical protein